MKQVVDKTTHYLKPPQAYVTIVFVEIIKRKAQPQQTQIQDNLIACVQRGTQLIKKWFSTEIFNN